MPPADGVLGTLLVFADNAVLLLPIVTLAVALALRWWVAVHFVFLASFGGGLIVEALIKPLVARPRPPVILDQTPPDSYGFPSGTAFLVFTLMGMICYLLWPTLKWHARSIVAVELLLVVSASRVYTGEHWLTDVLGGWIFGGAWLVLLITVHRRWTA